MDAKEFLALVLIVFLSLWGALYIEVDLARYFVLELFIILVLIVFSIGIFYSITAGKRWAWKGLSAFFIASFVNLGLVYFITGNTPSFMILLFVNATGLAMVLSKKSNITLREKEDIPSLPDMPIYHIQERDLIDHFDTYELNPEEVAEIRAELNSSKKKVKRKLKKKKK